MNLLKKLLRRLFQKLCTSKAKQQRHAFQEWQRARPPGLPDVPTIDLAKTRVRETGPVTPVPGTVLEAYRAKHGLKTIRLEPLQNSETFPWLPDESWINSKLMPVIAPPVYEPSGDAHLSALHELLGCYAETEVKLKAVKKRHEGE
jgi:hypothetical protein